METRPESEADHSYRSRTRSAWEAGLTLLAEKTDENLQQIYSAVTAEGVLVSFAVYEGAEILGGLSTKTRDRMVTIKRSMVIAVLRQRKLIHD